ncbi:unnamed protein product [Diamesa serratosioi]
MTEINDLVEIPSDIDHSYKSPELKRITEAIDCNRIFRINGNYNTIRTSLVRRGWIEKCAPFSSNNTNFHEKFHKWQLFKKLQQKSEYFVWQPKLSDPIFTRANKSHPMTSKIIRSANFNFVTKSGLHSIAENIKSLRGFGGFTDLNYQRTYNLTDAKNKKSFVDDFRKTMMRSFLKYLNSMKDFSTVFAESGTISFDCITFAINTTENDIRRAGEKDVNIKELPVNSYKHQIRFQEFDSILNRKNRQIKVHKNFIMDDFKQKLKDIVSKIDSCWPHTKRDGYQNLWIVKPSNLSRGIGIKVLNYDFKVLNHIRNHPTHNFLVQKYIETPLLIHNTKFDIRFYFLTVIRKQSVEIWMYKNCYLRFSSVEFTLNNLHESIHLTNYSIQKHYTARKNRLLPDYNMWPLKDFKKHLITLNKDSEWENHIYPTMKENILAVVLISLPDTTMQEGSFELNGADFLIANDFEPILLEINSNPDLSFSTPTTKVLCSQVMEDVIKVVIDYAEDENVLNTGDFELVHKHIIN